MKPKHSLLAVCLMFTFIALLHIIPIVVTVWTVVTVLRWMNILS